MIKFDLQSIVGDDGVNIEVLRETTIMIEDLLNKHESLLEKTEAFKYYQYAYVSPQVDLIVTGQVGDAAFSLLNGKGVFYKTSNNIWRLRFNLYYTQTNSSTADITIGNVSWAEHQAVSACQSVVNRRIQGVTNNTGGLIYVETGVASTTFYVSGDVELASKPTGYNLPDEV